MTEMSQISQWQTHSLLTHLLWSITSPAQVLAMQYKEQNWQQVLSFLPARLNMTFQTEDEIQYVTKSFSRKLSFRTSALNKNLTSRETQRRKEASLLWVKHCLYFFPCNNEATGTMKVYNIKNMHLNSYFPGHIVGNQWDWFISEKSKDFLLFLRMYKQT